MDWASIITILAPTFTFMTWIYSRIDKRFDRIESRMDRMDTDIKELRTSLNRMEEAFDLFIKIIQNIKEKGLLEK